MQPTGPYAKERTERSQSGPIFFGGLIVGCELQRCKLGQFGAREEACQGKAPCVMCALFSDEKRVCIL
jgi:hypothetical protein